MKELSEIKIDCLTRQPENFSFQGLVFSHLKTSIPNGFSEIKWISRVGNVNIVFSILVYSFAGMSNTQSVSKVRCSAYINYTHIGFVENLAHLGQDPKTVLGNLFDEIHSGKTKSKLATVLFNLQRLEKKLDTLVDDFTVVDILE